MRREREDTVITSDNGSPRYGLQSRYWYQTKCEPFVEVFKATHDVPHWAVFLKILGLHCENLIFQFGQCIVQVATPSRTHEPILTLSPSRASVVGPGPICNPFPPFGDQFYAKLFQPTFYPISVYSDC